MNTEKQINVRPLDDGDGVYGYAAEILLCPNDPMASEWHTIGYFAEEATARNRALEAVRGG